MKSARKLICLAAAATLVAACERPPEPPPPPAIVFDTGQVEVRTARDTFRMRVEVASTEEQQGYGLMDRPRSGMPRRLNEAQMRELAEIVETGPDPAVDGVVRWRRIDLRRVIEERFGVVYSERAITDLLKALSFCYISGRPQHPGQDARVVEAFKKTSR